MKQIVLLLPLLSIAPVLAGCGETTDLGGASDGEAPRESVDGGSASDTDADLGGFLFPDSSPFVVPEAGPSSDDAGVPEEDGGAIVDAGAPD